MKTLLVVKVNQSSGQAVDFDAAVNLMDKDVLDSLDFSQMSEQEMFDAYCVAHAEEFDGEEFIVN